MSDKPYSMAPVPGQLRTLAVRITEDLRAQLDVLSQLTGRTATEEIRLALEHWIEKTKSDPVILEKAVTARAEIEREAQTRRKAIAAIFGGGDDEEKADAQVVDVQAEATPKPETTETPTAGRSNQRRSKPAGE